MSPTMSIPALHAGVLRLTFGAGLIMLAGCATAPSGDLSQSLARVPAAQLAKVEATAAAGDAIAAADAYLEMAAKFQSPARQALKLRAAESFYVAGAPYRALRTLSAIDNQGLDAAGRHIRQFLTARAALQAALPERALDALDRVGAFGLSPTQRIERLGLMAAAYRHQGDPVQAAQMLDQIDRLLDKAPEQIDNQLSLLMTLSLLQPSSLEQLQQRGSGRLRAWAGLSALLARYDSADATMLASYARWRSAHRSLPVGDTLPRAYYAALAGAYAPGADAWVLLPRSGHFSNASAAIYAGISHTDENNRSGTRPQLKRVDSSANVDNAYQQALAAGADIVIGPLQKPAVDQISQRTALPVPTLALNRNSQPRAVPQQLYELALAPEDEAVSVANFAWASGLRSALLLYPQGAWGNRIAGAFRTHWSALGGKIAAESVYGATQASMGTAVETLLAPATGELLFMVATSNDARTLWRHLGQANQRRLPVLATSHVHAGNGSDASLAGLYFVDIPWLLRSSQSAVDRRLQMPTPARNTTLTHLHALGVDSYRLAPRSQAMQSHPGHFFAGVSGGLSFDGSGRVMRELSLARFGAAGPVPMVRIVRERDQQSAVAQ